MDKVQVNCSGSVGASYCPTGEKLKLYARLHSEDPADNMKTANKPGSSDSDSFVEEQV